MASDYTKVYPGFFQGSLRDQPPYARLMFLAMLTQADENGVVLGAPSFWAALVSISIDEVNQSLAILSAPDPDSTTTDEEGRRIVPWGDGANRWRIVNYRKYYERSRNEDRRAYKTEWQANKRTSVDTSGQVKTEVDEVDPENDNENDISLVGDKPPRKRVFRLTADQQTEFKLAYPKRKGDQNWPQVWKKLEAAVNSGAEWSHILAGAARYAALQKSIGKVGSEYVKQAASWANQQGWLDEIDAVATNGHAPIRSDRPEGGRWSQVH